MNFYDKLLFAHHLEEGETLEHVVHRHWFSIFRTTATTTLFGLLPPLAIIFFVSGITFANPLFWLSAVWLFLGILSFLYLVVDWYYDAWLLTDQCLIDIEWKGLFQRSSARVEYTAIDGVAYELNGFWAYILGFGDMRIDKVSTQAIELPGVANPKSAESLILEQQEKFVTTKNSTDSEAIKSLLAEVIKSHVKEK